MRQHLLVLALAAALVLTFGGTALAGHGAPRAGCPDGFELHHMHMMGDADHMHHHIGNDADRNGDGFLCVKHVGKDGNNHVHIDNNVPCDPKPERCVVSHHGM
jgi:hypothetical protein